MGEKFFQTKKGKILAIAAGVMVKNEIRAIGAKGFGRVNGSVVGLHKSFFPKQDSRMIKSNYKKGNDTIAKHMGLTRVRLGYWGDDESAWQKNKMEWCNKHMPEAVGEYYVNVIENKCFHIEELQYHTSWDLLFPVMEDVQITFGGTFIFPTENTCERVHISPSNKHSLVEVLSHAESATTIEATWLTIVDLLIVKN